MYILFPSVISLKKQKTKNKISTLRYIKINNSKSIYES